MKVEVIQFEKTEIERIVVVSDQKNIDLVQVGVLCYRVTWSDGVEAMFKEILRRSRANSEAVRPSWL